MYSVKALNAMVSESDNRVATEAMYYEMDQLKKAMVMPKPFPNMMYMDHVEFDGLSYEDGTPVYCDPFFISVEDAFDEE